MSSTTRVGVSCFSLSARPSASYSHTCRSGPIAFVLVGLLLIAAAQAQITDVTNVTSTPIQGAGHDYIKLFSETVSPSNGSVSLRIQVPTPPGRRLSLPFAFAYDTNGAHHVESSGTGVLLWWDNTAALATGGWSYSLPVLSNVLVDIPGGIGPDCVYYNNYVFQDETGGRHSLYLALVPTPTSCPGKTSKLVGGDDYYQAVLSSNQTQPLPIADADGTVYTFPSNLPYTVRHGNVHPPAGGGQLNSQPQSGLPTSIEDRNGNIISIADHGHGAFTVTDTVGRTMLSSSAFGSSGNTVTASGLGGSYTLTWGTARQNFGVGSALVYTDGYCAAGIHNDVQTLNVITKITLPNNDTYNFSYDSTYGVLSKITYPNGAYVSYTYALNPLSEQAVFEDTNGKNTCILHYDTPAVAHRYVSFDGVNVALQQDFSYSTTWATSYPYAWTSKNTTVTTTDKISNPSQPYTTSYTYAPISLPRQPNDHTQFGGQVTVENTVVYKDSTGAMLRTVAKGWNSQYELQYQQTTLENTQTSKTAYTYGPGAQITERDDYDYGSGAPGSLLRQIKTTYQTFPSTPIFPSEASIFDRPCKVVTYDINSNRMAEADYTYDGGTTVCGTAGTPSVQDVSGLPSGTHDETNYSASSTASRGNVTTKTQWLSTGTSPVTTYTYDKTGQVLTVKDPCGNATCGDMSGSNHTTSYSYADSYTELSGGQNVTYTPTAHTNAYMTQVTDPLTHVANFTYDYNNAQLTVAKDPNSQSDTYIYNDAFARPTQMNYPDLGQTSFSYNDALYNQTNNTPNVQTTKAIASGINLTTKTAMDGMGHVVRSLLTSDPAGTDTTDTTYDGPGRMRTQSNPHRSGSSSTDGTATHNYDPLGRPMTIVQQDGSTVTTTYSGNCTTVTDEALKSRKSCSDGLGRLTQVFEDPSVLNYETDYSYDALGNLLTVSQKGNDPNSAHWRPRTFTYDALSRLLTASNPESGNLIYTYDNNGNVTTKTDARSIVITNTYDVGNRMTGKTYSNSDPGVSYSYDAFVSGSNYGIGRRTGMTDGSGSTSWTYDTMGRVWSETRTIGTIAKTISNQYNLDGSIKQITYPSGSGSVIAYTYDAAAHLTLVKDTAHTVTYFQNTSYFPPGELNQATYGSVVETGIFNNRLQPCWYYATTGTPLPANTACSGTTTAANVLDLKYNFGAGTNDNGNVQGLTNDKDSNRSVAYTYDALNRIASATTPNTDCTVLPSGITKNWGETFTIDPWGNLTNRTVTKCSAEPLSVTALNNNQLSGFGYDADGNMTSNGGASYSYDGENRLKTTAGVTYTYDGDGNRVEKSSGTLYWGAGPMLESDLSGNFQREFIFAGSRRVARRDISGGAVYYYFTDHLGSSDVVTTSSGTIQNESDYFPYGGERVYSQTLASQNYKFTGKERDSESGLDEFGARYYGSSLGRFMTPDWAARPTAVPYAVFGDPQSLNLYGYVRNDPVSRADADGHLLNGASQAQEACAKGTVAACDSVKTAQKPIPLGGAPPAPDPAHVHTDAAPATSATSAQKTTCTTNCHVSTAVQTGNMQVDNEGHASVVIGPPVAAVSGTLNVMGAKSDQTLLATPTVGLGKYVSVGTDVVQDPGGIVHPQGGSFSLGLSWPPWAEPVNVAVPAERFTPSGNGIDPTLGWNLPSPL